MSSFAAFEPPLSQAAGYSFLVLVGLGFAGGMYTVTKVLEKHLNKDSQSAEEFTVAGRTLGVGLTATGVVSSWGWPTALLWSASVTYLYGASGGWWYGACCVVMITGFAVVANQMKIRAPHAHTALEMVRLRYGSTVHVLFIFLMFVNSVIGVSMALLGASANISAITGIPVVASLFLLPFGVVVYTTFGGLRATILTDYLHTGIVFIILLYIAFKTITSEATGGLNEMYRLLIENSVTAPIEGNAGGGSYLTMGSLAGFEFGMISLFANMGLVVLDNSYWQKGIAASGKASVWGYLLGGYAYHALPFLSGTFGGLVALAYQNSPNWPTYPNGLSSTDVNNSVTLVYTALMVAGKGGAGAILVLVFMSMTSMASASVVGIAGLATFDVYKQYFNPTATNAQLVQVSHISVATYGLFVAVFSTAIQYGQVSQGWLAYMSGIVSCPGLFPLIFTAFWKKQSKIAILVSTIAGTVFGLAAWLGLAYRYFGEVSIASTQGLEPCLYGTAVSLFLPVPVTVIISLIFPDNFSWDQFNKLEIIENGHDFATSPGGSVNDEKTDPIVSAEDERLQSLENIAEAKKLSKVAWIGFVISVLLWWGIVPFPLYGTGYVFSLAFFKGWLGVGIAWGFCSGFLLVIYPIIEGRHELAKIYRGVIGRQ